MKKDILLREDMLWRSELRIWKGPLITPYQERHPHLTDNAWPLLGDLQGQGQWYLIPSPQLSSLYTESYPLSNSGVDQVSSEMFSSVLGTFWKESQAGEPG